MAEMMLSFHKARMVNRIEDFNSEPPSDLTIWIRRHWTAERWVARVGVPYRVIRGHMRRRGYRGGPEGLTEAPCRSCGQRKAVELLSSIQLCDDCGAGTPETLCRVERQGRTRLAHLARTYSPGVSRKPVLISAVLGGP